MKGKKKNKRVANKDLGVNMASQVSVQEYELLKSKLKFSSLLIRGLNVAVTFAGVVIGISAVAVPVLNYYYVILPSERIEQTVDKRISKFLEANESREIELNYDKIVGNNSFEIQNGIDFFASHPGAPLNELQLFNILEPLRQDTVDENLKLGIGNFVAHRKSRVVDEFFLSKLLRKDGDVVIKIIAVSHFTNDEYKGDLSVIEKGMRATAKKDLGSYYFGVVGACQDANASWIEPVLNSKTMVDYCMDKDYLTFFRGDFAKYSRPKISKSVYLKTYAFTKMY